MTDIPPEFAQRVANAARALAIARNVLQNARGWEAQQQAQKAFDAAQEEMVNAGNFINRGITREENAQPS